MLYKVTGAGHSVCVCVCVCACVCVCVGGGMSEFSGAWGKRGEGGQGREGVQLPDSLMDEVKSSHLYLYSAFNNTNCVKATAQYQNRKIVSQ